MTRHDGCDSHVKHGPTRERGVPKQNSARLSVSLQSLIRGGGPVRQHEIKLSSRCWLYTAVKPERDKQCLGGREHSCGQNSGLWGFVAQRSVRTSQSIFLNELWHVGFGWSSQKRCTIYHNSPHLMLSRFFFNFSPSVSVNRFTSLFPSSPSYILILLCMSCVPWPLCVTWHLRMHEETHSSQCRMTFSPALLVLSLAVRAHQLEHTPGQAR